MCGSASVRQKLFSTETKKVSAPASLFNDAALVHVYARDLSLFGFT